MAAITYHDTEGGTSLLPSAIPASIGQQVFSITSGIAGGMAGLVLASRLQNSTRVHLQPVIFASVISAVATFAVVYMITSPDERGPQ